MALAVMFPKFPWKSKRKQLPKKLVTCFHDQNHHHPHGSQLSSHASENFIRTIVISLVNINVNININIILFILFHMY